MKIIKLFEDFNTNLADDEIRDELKTISFGIDDLIDYEVSIHIERNKYGPWIDIYILNTHPLEQVPRKAFGMDMGTEPKDNINQELSWSYELMNSYGKHHVEWKDFLNRLEQFCDENNFDFIIPKYSRKSGYKHHYHIEIFPKDERRGAPKPD